ncbi:MAG: hypothetical protein LIO56_03740 [Lachnospiraceae bacterium]|nr:hypothetical protein [Lachnospiraceae bacterium]
MKTAAEPAETSASHKRRNILIIVIIVVAVIVVSGLAVFLSKNHTGTGSIPMLQEARVTLSEENIAAGQEAIEIVDNYLDDSTIDALLYGSESAASDLREVKNSLVAEENAASEEVRQELEDDIDQIILELDLNEKSISNGLRIIEGGDTADRDAIQSSRDDIESLINIYS